MKLAVWIVGLVLFVEKIDKWLRKDLAPALLGRPHEGPGTKERR